MVLITSSCSVDKKNQLDVTFVFFISLLLVAKRVCVYICMCTYVCMYIYIYITQSSAPDDGHMVARNMLSN